MSFVVFADGTANLPASCQEGVTMLPCSYFVEGVEQEYLGGNGRGTGRCSAGWW